MNKSLGKKPFVFRKAFANNADSREKYDTRVSRPPRHCSPRACPRTTATHTSECHVSEPLAGGALAGQGRRAFRRVPERPRFRKLAALGRSPPRQLRSLRALRQRRVPRARNRALRLRRVRGTPSRRPKPPCRPETDHTRSTRARSAPASYRRVVASRAKSSRSGISFATTRLGCRVRRSLSSSTLATRWDD